MIDINELRRLAQAVVKGWGNCDQAWLDQSEDTPAAVVGHIDEDGETYPVATIDCDQYYAGHQSLPLARFYAAANPAAINELLDRLEAAEKECNALRADKATLQQMTYSLKDHLEAAEKERDELRAKIAQMEKQEPVASIYIDGKGDREFDDWKCDLPAGSNPLYALPGAQPAPSVPNLDMDALERQNDELKEEVGRLRDALALIADQYEPKCNLLIPNIARSALCATGSYGQTKAQPAPCSQRHRNRRNDDAC